MLVPPELFGLVEKDIYRSNTLKPENFPFIKTLNLRTALLLSPEIPTRTVSFFFEESGIKLVRKIILRIKLFFFFFFFFIIYINY